MTTKKGGRRNSRSMRGGQPTSSECALINRVSTWADMPPDIQRIIFNNLMTDDLKTGIVMMQMFTDIIKTETPQTNFIKTAIETILLGSKTGLSLLYISPHLTIRPGVWYRRQESNLEFKINCTYMAHVDDALLDAELEVYSNIPEVVTGIDLIKKNENRVALNYTLVMYCQYNKSNSKLKEIEFKLERFESEVDEIVIVPTILIPYKVTTHEMNINDFITNKLAYLQSLGFYSLDIETNSTPKPLVKSNFEWSADSQIKISKYDSTFADPNDFSRIRTNKITNIFDILNFQNIILNKIVEPNVEEHRINVALLQTQVPVKDPASQSDHVADKPLYYTKTDLDEMIATISPLDIIACIQNNLNGTPAPLQLAKALAAAATKRTEGQPGQPGGAKVYIPTPTPHRLLIGNRQYVVYKGMRSARFIKKNGVFINIKNLGLAIVK
jgi:hypothetical protein